jgi:type I restriction enzyme M protein
MNVIENIKEGLFNQLDNCLHLLGGYEINSLMPLLYVLVAHHEGHRVSIIGDGSNIFAGKQHIQSVEAVDEYESDLLKRIRSSVHEAYFEGQSAEIVFRFYETCSDYINDYYQEIIEYIILTSSSRAGKFSGLNATTPEIAHLMGELIARQDPKTIYDPCAGLCSYELLPILSEKQFVCQEISPFIKLIADIRVEASGKYVKIINEDSTFNWRGNEADCLASELPFGVTLNDITQDENRPKMLEDFVIYEFVRSEALRKAVLLVSLGTCFRHGRSFDIRKTLCEKNYVDTVIKLPAGIYPGTGVSTVILVLNKDKSSKDIKFVQAEDCIISGHKSRKLDTHSVLSRIDSKEDNQVAVVPSSETFAHDCILDPSTYLQENIELLPGQKLVKLLSFATKVRGERHYDDKQGRVLTAELMTDSIAEMHSRDYTIVETILEHPYVKISDKCIIFNVRADKFFIKKDEEPLFVSPNFTCFQIDESKYLPEYIADCIVKAEYFRNNSLIGTGMPKLQYDHLLLPVYESLDSQAQIIQRIYRQEQNELKKKLERLQVLSGQSSDLIHNLGMTFIKIGAGIAEAKDIVDNSVVKSLDDNVKFALRQINSTGTDFEFVKPELKKVYVYNILKEYINAWKNFGYSTFKVRLLDDETDANINYMALDTKIEVDPTLFYTMLDCIFINAHQHGFLKQNNKENQVIVVVEGVSYNDKHYARIGISNNGNPLPEGFTVRDFVARGVVGINSSQDGIGGDHVCKITHHFGGVVSIDSDNDWLTFNILLPVYITSTDNFNEYEYESV